MQWAAVSCPSNIVEGSAKSSDKDFARILEISHGSLIELETELIVSHRLGHFDDKKLNDTQNKIIELQKMIYKFLKSNSTKIKYLN